MKNKTNNKIITGGQKKPTNNITIYKDLKLYSEKMEKLQQD